MKIMHKNLKKGEIKIKVDNLDDLWYISQIVDSKDLIKGKTLRKIKIGDDNPNSNKKVVRKPVFMEISAEKVEFSKTTSILRITGKIKSGPEDVPLGTYHTFNIEENTEFTIIKERWLCFQLDKIEEAVAGSKSKILMVIFDREEAHFAIIKNYGYDYLSSIKGDVQKKGNDEKKSGNFYEEIIKQIKSYDERYKLTGIIVSSPAFWKDEFQKSLKDDVLKKKIIFASCSTVGKKAFDELLRRDEVKTALKTERASKEISIVEKLLDNISQDGKAAYGLKEVALAVESGAVETLIVTDSLIWKAREEENFQEIEKLLKDTEKAKGKVMIISREHEGGKKLDGLGGIGAILRFDIS